MLLVQSEQSKITGKEERYIILGDREGKRITTNLGL